MAFLVIFLVMGIGTAVYLTINPWRPTDLILAAINFSLVFFLSRFNGLLTVWLDKYPLVTIHFYLLALLVFLGLVRALGKHPISRICAIPLPFLAVYSFFSILSGFVNAGFDGVLGAIQVVVITVTPALLAWILVELVGRQSQSPAELRRLYILPLGVVTPLILMVSALLPGVFSGLLGWELSVDFGGDEGFLRGWSPLGSTILTGSLVVIAFGFALHEAVVNRSRLHTVVASLASASVLFTASRAVMIVFVLFNFIYWPMVGKWRTFVRVSFLPAAVFIAIVGWSLVTGAISFERFLEVRNQSSTLRASSAVAAFELGREKTFLGHGPGQVYHEIRTIWVANPKRRARVMERPINGRMSAMEPHNLYLYLFAEHGLIATLAFVLAMFSSLIALWRQKPGSDPTIRSERAVFLGLGVGLVFIFLTASWPLMSPQYSVFLWLFVFSSLHSVDNCSRKAVS